MICPKCQNAMRTVDRLGIHIDQCDSCRGIFLDRGELEKLTAAESHWQGTAAAAPAAQHPQTRPGYGGGYPQHKRRKSFLEELFD